MTEPVVWDDVRLPFPYFGGKSRVADVVWRRFGRVSHYIEPFCGGCGVLLGRDVPNGDETINDACGFITNFWRAAKYAPHAVADYCDWPVSEADLHARHKWLLGQAEEVTRRLMEDPKWHDPKVAGWWCWGQSIWIGSGWCSEESLTGTWTDGDLPDDAMPSPDSTPGDRIKQHPTPGNAGGTHRKKPNLGRQNGVHRRIPHLYGTRGVHHRQEEERLYEYFKALAERLRRVRILCGDWRRVLTRAVVKGRDRQTGIFLDPPYTKRAKRRSGLYRKDDEGVGDEVFKWAVQNGMDMNLRIAVCGYEGEYDFPKGWTEYAWKSVGYGKNRDRERVWFSPYCLARRR